MHVLAKTAKEVKKEEEEKLVKLIEHTCEWFFFPLILLRVTSAGVDADQNTPHLSLQGSPSPRTTAPRNARPSCALRSPPPPAGPTAS